MTLVVIERERAMSGLSEPVFTLLWLARSRLWKWTAPACFLRGYLGLYFVLSDRLRGRMPIDILEPMIGLILPSARLAQRMGSVGTLRNGTSDLRNCLLPFQFFYA